MIGFALAPLTSSMLLAAAQPLSLTLSANRTSAAPGDYLELRFALKNISGETLDYEPSTAAVMEFRIEAIGPDGLPARESKAAAQRRAHPIQGPNKSPGERMEADETVSSSAEAGAFVDLSVTGTYSLKAFWPGRASTPLVESNSLLITIVSAEDHRSRFASVLARAEALHPAPTASPLAIQIETDIPIREAGHHFVVSYKLYNTTNKVVDLTPGTLDNVAVEVRREDGTLVPDLASNRRAKEQIRKDEEKPREPYDFDPAIKPGGKYIGNAFPDVMTDISQPGIYSVQLFRRLPDKLGGAEIRSNVIVIEVKPAAAAPGK